MAGDLSRRIPLAGSGDEFDQLASEPQCHARAHRAADERPARGLRQYRPRSQDAAQTRLRNRAEAALRDPAAAAYSDGLERTIEEADELIKTFNALLLIARLEAGAVEGSAEGFDLGALTRDVAELYEPVAEEAGQRCCLGGAAARRPRQPPARQPGGRQSHRQCHQVRPAGRAARGVDHGRGDGGRRRRAHRGRRPRTGIPADDRERVAKRFVRLEQSRSRPGTGLGLSLVAAVARLHGGRMLLEDNAPGLEVALALPIGASGCQEGGQ